MQNRQAADGCLFWIEFIVALGSLFLCLALAVLFGPG